MDGQTATIQAEWNNSHPPRDHTADNRSCNTVGLPFFMEQPIVPNGQKPEIRPTIANPVPSRRKSSYHGHRPDRRSTWPQARCMIHNPMVVLIPQGCCTCPQDECTANQESPPPLSICKLAIAVHSQQHISPSALLSYLARQALAPNTTGLRAE